MAIESKIEMNQSTVLESKKQAMCMMCYKRGVALSSLAHLLPV